MAEEEESILVKYNRRKRSRSPLWYELLCELHRPNIVCHCKEDELMFCEFASIHKKQLLVWVLQYAERLPSTLRCDCTKNHLRLMDGSIQHEPPKKTTEALKWENYGKFDQVLRTLFEATLNSFRFVSKVDAKEMGLGFEFYIYLTSFTFQEMCTFYKMSPDYFVKRFEPYDGDRILLTIEVTLN